MVSAPSSFAPGARDPRFAELDRLIGLERERKRQPKKLAKLDRQCDQSAPAGEWTAQMRRHASDLVLAGVLAGELGNCAEGRRLRYLIDNSQWEDLRAEAAVIAARRKQALADERKAARAPRARRSVACDMRESAEMRHEFAEILTGSVVA